MSANCLRPGVDVYIGCRVSNLQYLTFDFNTTCRSSAPSAAYTVPSVQLPRVSGADSKLGRCISRNCARYVMRRQKPTNNDKHTGTIKLPPVQRSNWKNVSALPFDAVARAISSTTANCWKIVSVWFGRRGFLSFVALSIPCANVKRRLPLS